MLKEEENRVREEERRLLEEEVRIKEQELKKQHLLWQQQRISELQDTWTKHTTEEEKKSESSLFEEDPLMLEYQSRSEDIAGIEQEKEKEEELKSAEEQREEDEEEEVRRLQSELHAQLLAQVVHTAIPHICHFLHSQIFWRMKFTQKNANFSR